MRIIGGKYKGHPLVRFQADHIRPTTDRVKESLFNIWQGYVEESKVLDLFSGTGSLGLEAISRGASHVVFVESHRKSLDILKQNLRQLKIADGFEIVPKEVRAFLRSYKGEPFDLLLVDPPFTEKMAHEVMEHIASSQVIGPGSMIAIESGAKERMEDQYGILRRSDVRNYGDKLLSIFQRSDSEVS